MGMSKSADALQAVTAKNHQKELKELTLKYVQNRNEDEVTFSKHAKSDILYIRSDTFVDFEKAEDAFYLVSISKSNGKLIYEFKNKNENVDFKSAKFDEDEFISKSKSGFFGLESSRTD